MCVVEGREKVRMEVAWNEVRVTFSMRKEQCVIDKEEEEVEVSLGVVWPVRLWG